MSERLEEIKQGKEAMKKYFNRPDFELKTFNYDLVIDDLEYLIEQNNRYKHALKHIRVTTNDDMAYSISGKALEDK